MRKRRQSKAAVTEAEKDYFTAVGGLIDENGPAESEFFQKQGSACIRRSTALENQLQPRSKLTMTGMKERLQRGNCELDLEPVDGNNQLWQLRFETSR